MHVQRVQSSPFLEITEFLSSRKFLELGGKKNLRRCLQVFPAGRLAVGRSVARWRAVDVTP